MGHKKSILSEESKTKIAGELGVKDEVEKAGWGDVSAKNCGNIVKNAVAHGIAALKTKR
ncbi:MAG TPA: small, acid-soluble spore protein, alpha/beta type [Clostridiales bacterium]|nr:small, acid-soluble spore protein, alpha/beta type [Clostridiales bacterium]